jgi:protein-disulfide isomerase
MRRFLPLAIIGAVFLIAIGSGWLLFRGKQSTSSPVAPVPPVVPVASTSPVTSASPAAPASPGASVVQTPPAAATAPVPPPGAESLHVRGSANAPVTIEEYGDFQCIPCAQLFPILAKVEEDYGAQLRVVFRHKPLRKHEHAVLAAHAAEAAGLQGRFWEMHDLLFQNSLRWTKGVDGVGPEASPSRRLESKILGMEIEVRDVLISYAERLELDIERFKTDMDSTEIKARVESDRARGDSLGIDRTPTLYINGRLVPYPSLTGAGLYAVIDAELKGKRQPAGPATAQPTASEQPK